MPQPEGDAMSAIKELLDESDQYPKPNGTVGFSLNRDQLIAVLQECTPALSSISCIPIHHDGDLTDFEITTYVSFARSELTGASDDSA